MLCHPILVFVKCSRWDLVCWKTQKGKETVCLQMWISILPRTPLHYISDSDTLPHWLKYKDILPVCLQVKFRHNCCLTVHPINLHGRNFGISWYDASQLVVCSDRPQEFKYVIFLAHNLTHDSLHPGSWCIFKLFSKPQKSVRILTTEGFRDGDDIGYTSYKGFVQSLSATLVKLKEKFKLEQYLLNYQKGSIIFSSPAHAEVLLI